jgi:hypothetical protein
MPRFQAIATAQPTVIRAFQAPAPPTTPLPANLWFEGGVLWAMGSPPDSDNAVPIAFTSAGAFQQCIQANNSTSKNFTCGIGPGIYGSAFMVAHWSQREGYSNGKPAYGHIAWIATSISSRSIIQAFLSNDNRFTPSADLIFPKQSFHLVNAPSPSGNVTIPFLPLVLVSPVPARYTMLGTGLQRPYFYRGST